MAQTLIIKSANHFDAQIARMARDSLSNPEIGGGLFLSARTT
jgi:microcystin degradation protein MlrC